MTPRAKLYGGSLYELTAEEKREAAVLEQMTQVVQLFSEHPDYVRLLSTPSIPKAERCGLIDEAFRGQIDPYLLNFLKILCENGMMAELAECTREVRNRYNAEHGIVEAVATAAIPMTEVQKKALRQKLEAITQRQVDLECLVDPKVLGGIRLDIEGTRLDGTVEGRLDQLRKEISSIVI